MKTTNKKTKTKTHTKRIGINLTDVEHDTFTKKADDAGAPLATWIRMTLREKAGLV